MHRRLDDVEKALETGGEIGVGGFGGVSSHCNIRKEAQVMPLKIRKLQRRRSSSRRTDAGVIRDG